MVKLSRTVATVLLLIVSGSTKIRCVGGHMHYPKCMFMACEGAVSRLNAWLENRE